MKTREPIGLESLVREAEGLPLGGWSFERIHERWQTGSPPWDYADLVRKALHPDLRLLDLGTGGGEFLSSFNPLPERTYATEGYPPNLPVARERLEPLGVRVLPVGPDQKIPLPPRSVDLVIDRHEAFDAREVARVLVPGGRFLTQQVGGQNYPELYSRFGAIPGAPYNQLESAEQLAEEMAPAGFRIDRKEEATWPERFLDVGAVVYFLRMAPWEVPGFSAKRFEKVLRALQEEIRSRGYWGVTAHRLLVTATRT